MRSDAGRGSFKEPLVLPLAKVSSVVRGTLPYGLVRTLKRVNEDVSPVSDLGFFSRSENDQSRFFSFMDFVCDATDALKSFPGLQAMEKDNAARS